MRLRESHGRRSGEDGAAKALYTHSASRVASKGEFVYLQVR